MLNFNFYLKNLFAAVDQENIEIIETFMQNAKIRILFVLNKKQKQKKCKKLGLRRIKLGRGIYTIVLPITFILIY